MAVEEKTEDDQSQWDSSSGRFGMFVQNFLAICLKVVGIFQSRSKWWTKQPTDIIINALQQSFAPKSVVAYSLMNASLTQSQIEQYKLHK